MRALHRVAGWASPGDVRPFGDAALVFGARSPKTATALGAAVRSAAIEGVEDVVAGFDSVLAIYDPHLVDFETLAGRIRSMSGRRERNRSAKVVVLPTSFDGPDLDEVGQISGLGPDGVKRALLARTLRVSVLGFTPGFAYLSGLPRRLHRVARRPTPRASVPAGSLAIADGHAAVYPQSTPGGWHLVGRTDAALFDPDHPPYALLEPGDRVRLREVEPSELGPVAVPRRRVPWRSTGGCVFEVESPGVLTTVQDRGRRGLAHLGVPRAGAADPVSFGLANRLVGNGPDAGCLEATVRGPALVCRRATHVAVVGAGTEVTLDGMPVGVARVLPVAPGQRLAVGPTGSGLRAYLAVQGGFAVSPVLGSGSTDRLVGLGPGPIEAGDELDAGPVTGPLADHLRPGAPGQASPEGPRRLRAMVWAGAPPAWRFELFGRPFAVDEASDRVGIRLRAQVGPPLSPHQGHARSSGTTVGTVQVPPDGNPVVLLVDHATLGGYPVAAVVIAADLGELGRCRPGDTIELAAVTPEEAAAALGSLTRALKDSIVGSYPITAG